MKAKSPLLTLSLIILGLSCLLLLYPTITQAFYKIPTSYNEGWNAAHALAAMAGDNIYHYPDRYLTNNYPPLYPYITGIAGSIFDDHIFPARVLSVLSFFTLIGLIFAISRSLTDDLRLSLFSALLFTALMAANYPIYIGINDPQLLANALSVAALTAIIILPTQRSTLLIAALLCLISGLIKHNLINVPLAISLFIFIRHRQYFIYWMALCSLLIGFSLIIIYQLYGEYFFDSFMSDRSFSLYRMFVRSEHYLTGLAIPLAFFAATLVLTSKNQFNLLLNSYAFIAVFTGILFSGGDGVSYNIVFDVCISLSIICAVKLQKLADLLSVNHMKKDLTITLVALALAITPFLNLPVQASASTGLRDILQAKEESTANDIGFLSKQGSPAICETMSLCYWANTLVEYDAFNTGQAMFKNPSLEKEILAKINSQHYSVIQLLVVNDKLNTERFPESFIATVNKSYMVARTNRARVFFIPKTNEQLANNYPDGPIKHTTPP